MEITVILILCSYLMILNVNKMILLGHFFNVNVEYHNIYLTNNIEIHPNIKELFKVADDIIHPSQFTYDIL